MRIYLDQNGCRLNYSEMEMLAGQLRQAGHVTVETPEQAQVVVFNSCAVTAEASRKSRQRVRGLAKRSPQARIAVTGCWATLQPKRVASLPNVALVVGNERKELLHTLLEPWSAELDDLDHLVRIQPDGTPFASLQVDAPDTEPTVMERPNGAADARAASELARRSRTRAFIKVQDGCNNRCTFCIVTAARGESRSRTVASIVAEIQQLAADGVCEAVLTGVHLGSYGRDLCKNERADLKILVAAILRHTDIARLRLSSLEPWELADGFYDLWTQWPQRLCPHLHLPLQAGTDRQLRRMARRCTTASYRQLVTDARAAIPGLVLTTDLIVGFPGETEADFAASMDYVAEMRFADAHIFPFSARAGTAAASFGARVAKETKKARSRRMRALAAKMGQAERARFVNDVRPVLWEGVGERLSDQPGALWSGFTDNYLRVKAVVPENVRLKNTITWTRLDEIQGNMLFGTLIDANERN